MKPLCEICNSRHESYQAHVFATNKDATNRNATNKKTATNKVAASGAGSEVRLPVSIAGLVPTRAGELARGASVGGKVSLALENLAERGVTPEAKDQTANRRSREAYNAYQREYMRKKRGQARI
jgi:hypothetical protein